jgi:hypothetical protein
MAATRPELSCPKPSVVVLRADSRALIQRVGPTAWTVLLDVSLDACSEDAGWAANTSVRAIANHLALAPGTVARALGRLRAAGLVQRQDRRDRDTGRFVESVYVVLPTVAIQPCVDCPHTAEPDRAGCTPAGANAADRAAGQGLPEGMATVCRSLSGGERSGRASEEGLAREASSTEDGRGVARVGGESRSC